MLCKQATLLPSIHYLKVQKEAIVEKFIFYVTFIEKLYFEMSFIPEIKDENHYYFYRITYQVKSYIKCKMSKNI